MRKHYLTTCHRSQDCHHLLTMVYLCQSLLLNVSQTPADTVKEKELQADSSPRYCSRATVHQPDGIFRGSLLLITIKSVSIWTQTPPHIKCNTIISSLLIFCCSNHICCAPNHKPCREHCCKYTAQLLAHPRSHQPPTLHWNSLTGRCCSPLLLSSVIFSAIMFSTLNEYTGTLRENIPSSQAWCFVKHVSLALAPRQQMRHKPLCPLIQGSLG